MVFALVLNAPPDTGTSDLTGDFPGGGGKAAIQPEFFLQNVELESYLYFNPTDIFFFFLVTFNSLPEQGRQNPVRQGSAPAGFSVLPARMRVPITPSGSPG